MNTFDLAYEMQKVAAKATDEELATIAGPKKGLHSYERYKELKDKEKYYNRLGLLGMGVGGLAGGTLGILGGPPGMAAGAVLGGYAGSALGGGYKANIYGSAAEAFVDPSTEGLDKVVFVGGYPRRLHDTPYSVRYENE